MRNSSKRQNPFYVKIQAPDYEEIQHLKDLVESAYIVVRTRLIESDQGGYVMFINLLGRRGNG